MARKRILGLRVARKRFVGVRSCKEAIWEACELLGKRFGRSASTCQLLGSDLGGLQAHEGILGCELAKKRFGRLASYSEAIWEACEWLGRILGLRVARKRFFGPASC